MKVPRRLVPTVMHDARGKPEDGKAKTAAFYSASGMAKLVQWLRQVAKPSQTFPPIRSTPVRKKHENPPPRSSIAYLFSDNFRMERLSGGRTPLSTAWRRRQGLEKSERSAGLAAHLVRDEEGTGLYPATPTSS